MYKNDELNCQGVTLEVYSQRLKKLTVITKKTFRPDNEVPYALIKEEFDHQAVLDKENLN